MSNGSTNGGGERLPDGHVTVIGAGVVGMAVAYALRREGLPVTVVDRGEPGRGCSFGNAGAISPGSVAPVAMPGVLLQAPKYLMDRDGPLSIQWRSLPWLAPWLLRFVRSASPRRVEEISRALRALQAPALERYQALLEEIGGEDLLRRSGQLHLYPNEASRRKDGRVWSLRRARGVRVEEVGAAEISRLEPAVGTHYRCGVFLPDEGMTGNPFRLVQTIAEAFAGNGGRVVRADVAGFELGPSGPTHLRTTEHKLPLGRVVVAAGAWSHRLAEQLGRKVPLQTQRGYHVTFPDAGITIHRPVVAADAKCFATPMETGLRLAGTVELARLTAPPNYARARALIGHGRRLFPGLRDRDFSEWMGDRPSLPDSLPVIGRSPRFASVFYAFGHGHLGLTGAAVTADLIADLVVGRPARIDLAPYDIARFA